ncbi:MAG: molybdopterin-dependent oxidoreductase [Halioglobus sp.]
MSSELKVKTTCPYCGVGCGVEATLRDGDIIAVSGDKAHPANFGKLCVKGSALHETSGTEGRLLHPVVEGQQTDWTTALETVAQKLGDVRDAHGAEAIAFYLSGQLLTEDYYVANKLAKGFIGTGNVDTNSRLCMSSAVAGYKRAFGADAVPCSYEDLEQSELIVLTGSNAAWTHPVLYRRIVEAKRSNPKLRVVVIDPRRTATCDVADLHLPVAPGADNFVFQGLLAYLVSEEAIDREFIDKFTEGFDQAIAQAALLSLEQVAKESGLSIDALTTFFGWYSATEKTVTFYSQGINQSATGTDKCNAIINCHLATGRIGKVGAGPFSITGQPNAMGGREVGGLANMLAAHMDYTEENIATVGRFWNTCSTSNKPGLKAVDLFDAVERGKIKAIWIMGTNPAVSMPDADRVKAALEKCDTVIVSDCVAVTDTTSTANILLPACDWGEKSGTVTNSERRISRQRGMRLAPGQARPDWWIVSQVAQKMGFARAFDYSQARDIFVEHAALSGFENDGSRVFNIERLSELSEQEYDSLTPIQWPVSDTSPQGSQRLFCDHRFFTASGKAQFLVSTARLPQQTGNSSYPLILNTGRIRDQWHTMTRTARASRLLEHIGQPFVSTHPVTAKNNGLADGDLVRVTTELGNIDAILVTDAGMDPAALFAPIHWSGQYASNARVDALVKPITDAVSGQPEFKCTPAAIQKIETAQWAIILSRSLVDCSSFIFWNRTPAASIGCHIYEIAVTDRVNWQQFVMDKRLSESGPAQAYEHFCDATCADERFVCYSDQQLELVIYSHVDRRALPSPTWLQGLAEMSRLGESYWSILAGDAYQQRASGRRICSCFKVSEDRIVEAIEGGVGSVEGLGKQLQCGTNCGSCIPELNALLTVHKKIEAA